MSQKHQNLTEEKNKQAVKQEKLFHMENPYKEEEKTEKSKQLEGKKDKYAESIEAYEKQKKKENQTYEDDLNKEKAYQERLNNQSQKATIDYDEAKQIVNDTKKEEFESMSFEQLTKWAHASEVVDDATQLFKNVIQKMDVVNELHKDLEKELEAGNISEAIKKNRQFDVASDNLLGDSEHYLAGRRGIFGIKATEKGRSRKALCNNMENAVEKEKEYFRTRVASKEIIQAAQFQKLMLEATKKKIQQQVEISTEIDNGNVCDLITATIMDVEEEFQIIQTDDNTSELADLHIRVSEELMKDLAVAQAERDKQLLAEYDSMSEEEKERRKNKKLKGNELSLKSYDMALQRREFDLLKPEYYGDSQMVSALLEVNEMKKKDAYKQPEVKEIFDKMYLDFDGLFKEMNELSNELKIFLIMDATAIEGKQQKIAKKQTDMLETRSEKIGARMTIIRDLMRYLVDDKDVKDRKLMFSETVAAPYLEKYGIEVSPKAFSES